MKLHLDVALCVRATSKVSICTKCVDATNGLVQIEDQLPQFAKGLGVEAAACIGACPTEAFSLSDFSVTEFFFSFLESKARLISRKVNVPCLSVLSVEHLISLALASDEPVILDLHDYEEESHLFTVIESRVEEANFVLSSFSEKRLETNLDLKSSVAAVKQEITDVERDENGNKPSRRDFLSQASVKGMVKHKQTFEHAVEAEELHSFEIDESMTEKIRNKHLPDKRKILLTTLKGIEKPTNYDVFAEEDISFISQKFVSEACTNCQMCYRICPSGALSSDKKFSLIEFDAMLCLKCHLCHDVCEPNAIQLQPGFESKEFFEPSQRTLAKFVIKRCNECQTHFTYTGGEQICPRCLLEEEEAMFLHQNAKNMRGDV